MKKEERGRCSECRHANQGTMDAAEGFWACPWFGRTSAESLCEVKFKANGVYAFETFDGYNGTWNPNSGFRILPTGLETIEVEISRPTTDFDNWFD